MLGQGYQYNNVVFKNNFTFLAITFNSAYLSVALLLKFILSIKKYLQLYF